MSRRSLIQSVWIAVPFAAVSVLPTACSSAHSSSIADAQSDPIAATSTQAAVPAVSSVPRANPDVVQPAAVTVLTSLPGLGPRTSAAIPASAGQVVLATGAGSTSSDTTVQLFTRVPGGWQPAAPAWQGHNAVDGWTAEHHAGDSRSPVGVFGLTDAGGLLPDPGTKLRYTQSSGFTINGTGFRHEPLAGSFDYVIAINYNRTPGTSPMDPTMPMGASRGGGIWLHVDHGGPTHACVSVPRDDMRQLLLTLDPALKPVIVMGDRGSLAR
ncbi:L,D-peptidoglycan transpeptidase YkuD (ErfK/YbiS/YcfS/YnhG family) [Catenulispora sp. EB89]|uniref:L,D-transpeptidase family protein n=1 Tax=Catenulispora sp. EB89 TaxID=3156257 RepID=UPI00351853B6